MKPMTRGFSKSTRIQGIFIGEKLQTVLAQQALQRFARRVCTDPLHCRRRASSRYGLSVYYARNPFAIGCLIRRTVRSGQDCRRSRLLTINCGELGTAGPQRQTARYGFSVLQTATSTARSSCGFNRPTQRGITPRTRPRKDAAAPPRCGDRLPRAVLPTRSHPPMSEAGLGGSRS